MLSDAPYSFVTRFENGKGTNPEELIAAAHAGCFTMALSAQLGTMKFTPESLRTTATVTLEKLDAGWTISKIHLDVTGRLRGISAGGIRSGRHQRQAELPGVAPVQSGNHHDGPPGAGGMILPAVFGLLLITRRFCWEAFETVVLPRRVTRRLRITVLFYRMTWRPWRALARSYPHAKKLREGFLGYYGPLSLLVLFIFWATLLIFGFGLALSTAMRRADPRIPYSEPASI